MPPSKSNAGKAGDRRNGNGSSSTSRGPFIQGMRGRMSCQNTAKVSGMKGRSGMKVTGMKGSGMKVTGMKGSGMKVTGMKGRGGGGGTGAGSAQNGGTAQQKINFRAVKAAAARRRQQAKISPKSILSGNKQQDEALLKLRIPLHICSVLPSIKKFTAKPRGTKGQYTRRNMIFETEAKPSPEQQQQQQQQPQVPVFGAKKRKVEHLRYSVQLLREGRFQGMIWDVGFAPDGDLVVACSEGAMLCDPELNVRRRFANMFLPGAVGFLSDGRVLIVDRSSDTVNVYRKNATFIRSFMAGRCPMGLAVTATDDVYVSDAGDKCVRKFDKLGHHLLTIPTRGDDYALQWPLYLALQGNGDLVVSDVHQQRVLLFGGEGRFQRKLLLKTINGSSVLRPHGVSVTQQNELLAVDTSIDSLEVFSPGPDGCYVQTLLSPDDNIGLEPKLCKLNADNTLLAIGGMKGVVRIYQLGPVEATTPEAKAKPSRSTLSSPSQSSESLGDVVKEEIKAEPGPKDL